MLKLYFIVSLVLLVSFVKSTPLREGRMSGSARLNEPEIRKCLQSKMCPVTYDFKPTCASDGKTYVNKRTIYCLNECLKPEEQLTVVSGWYCDADAPEPAKVSN